MTVLTLDQYFKRHGRPADGVLIVNAKALVGKLNTLAAHFPAEWGPLPNDQVSGNPFASGYRSPEANARTSNAGKASTHIRCHGGDLQDWLDRRMAVWLCNHVSLLAEIGLWMEDPRWTAGSTNSDPWCHLQDVAPGSGRRIYVPSTKPPQDPLFYKRTGATYTP